MSFKIRHSVDHILLNGFATRIKNEVVECELFDDLHYSLE